MSSHMLDVVKDLIKTRDALAKVETEVSYLRRVVDGAVNDTVDWLKAQNIIVIKDDDGSERKTGGVEQPMVDRSCTQKGGAGADGDDESRESVQD